MPGKVESAKWSSKLALAEVGRSAVGAQAPAGRSRTSTCQRGVSIWLRADLDMLVRRCQKRTNRPLLQQGDMRATLQRLITERTPFYAEADLTVESGDGPHEQVVDAIIAALQARTAAARELAR